MDLIFGSEEELSLVLFYYSLHNCRDWPTKKCRLLLLTKSTSCAFARKRPFASQMVVDGEMNQSFSVSDLVTCKFSVCTHVY